MDDTIARYSSSSGQATVNAIQWITFVNQGYVHFATNFLTNRAALNLTFKLIVWCLDTESFILISSTSYCTGFVTCIILPKDVTGMSGDYPTLHDSGSIEYMRLTFLKLRATAYTRSFLSNHGIHATFLGFIDTDVALFRDPTPVFLQNIHEHPLVSVFQQCDEAHIAAPCSDASHCPMPNSGVIVFRNSPEILGILVSYTDEDILRYGSDQTFLRAEFLRQNVSSRTLPRNLLLNGAYIALDHHPREEQIAIINTVKDTIVTLHFNFILGSRKERAMRDLGFWYLDRNNKSPAKHWAEYQRCMGLLPSGRSCPPAPSSILPYSELAAHHAEMLQKTQTFRGRQQHSYAGYSGPWIENIWIDSFLNAPYETFYPLVPLFLQITDIWHLRESVKLKTLFENLRPDVLYVTVMQHDEGPAFLSLDATPCGLRNVLVLSSGGYGNVALPLIKGNLATQSVNKTRLFSSLLGFAGSLETHPVRSAIVEELHSMDTFPDNALLIYFGEMWKEMMASTMLPLAPRGYGRSSFRSSELVQLGLPQVYVYSDLPWLPYFDERFPDGRLGHEVVWGRGGLGIVASVSELKDLVDRLCAAMQSRNEDSVFVSLTCPPGEIPKGPPYAISPFSEIATMARRARELADSHFSYSGVMERIRDFFKTPWDADLVSFFCRDVERDKERPDEDDYDDDEEEEGDGDKEGNDGDTDGEEISQDEEIAVVDVSGDDKDLLLTSSKDPFFLRFSGSADGVDSQLVDIISAEAALKASRELTRIDLAPSVIPVDSIGANPESVDGTFLHGGAVNVHVSASVGAAADEMTDVLSIIGARKSSRGTNSSVYSAPHVDLSSSTGGYINKSLAKAWQSTYGSEPSNSFSDLPSHNTSESPLSQNLTPLQFSLWRPLSSYRDIHFTLRSFDNAREIRTLSALHIANHLSKARNLVSGHDRLIKEALLRMEEVKRDKLLKKDVLKQAKRSYRNDSLPPVKEGYVAGGSCGNSALSVSVPEFRDQGFSRPRVLVLLPHRHSALLFVRSLIRLLTEGGERQVANRGRFFSEFLEANEGGVGENVDEEEKVESSIEKDGVKGVLSKVPRAVREMMSDNEFDDNETVDAATDSENGEESHSNETYPFSKHQQGWPRHLKKKLEHARSIQRHAFAQRNEADSDNDDDDVMDDDTSLMKRRRGIGGRGRKRHKADRTERSLSALQKESILGSTVAYEASLGKKVKALERKAMKRERENQYALLNPVPKDFKKTFTGNIDDDFKLGISLSRRQMKLYSPFYESDLIVASPLGLRRVMGGEAEASREIDFLSSIEVVIVDEADLLLQQNWQHVKDIFSALNVTPISPQHTDFSRVRGGDLSGTLRFNRQTVIYSSYADAEISSLMKRSCYNAIGGQVLIRAGGYRGSVSHVVSAIRQSFVDVSTATRPRASFKTVAETDDAKLEAFNSLVLPLLKPRRNAGGGEEKSAQQPHTLIFIPSYFDYVRLRNLLDAEEVEFSTCSEYSDDKDLATSRKSFRLGDSTTILVTERFHFFRRVKFWGVKHVVFYGPPRVANSYAEVLDWVEEERSEKREEGALTTSLLLYSKFDGLQLERVCGSQRASSLLR